VSNITPDSTRAASWVLERRRYAYTKRGMPQVFSSAGTEIKRVDPMRTHGELIPKYDERRVQEEIEDCARRGQNTPAPSARYRGTGPTELLAKVPSAQEERLLDYPPSVTFWAQAIAKPPRSRWRSSSLRRFPHWIPEISYGA
jgi:hypothetical protein